MGCNISVYRQDDQQDINDWSLEEKFGPPIYPEVLMRLFITEQSAMYPEIANSLSFKFAGDDDPTTVSIHECSAEKQSNEEVNSHEKSWLQQIFFWE